MVMEVPLTRGYVALVDDEDFERVTALRWYALVWPKKPVYACAMIGTRTSKRAFRMHRFILDVAATVEVDHRNGDSLDNRRRNLRIATRLQNAWNARGHADSIVPFKGVSPHQGGFRARIMVSGRQLCLGVRFRPCRRRPRL